MRSALLFIIVLLVSAVPLGAALTEETVLLGHQIISPHLAVAGQQLPLDTFFPGTPDRAAAGPIVAGTATQHHGFDFTVVW